MKQFTTVKIEMAQEDGRVLRGHEVSHQTSGGDDLDWSLGGPLSAALAEAFLAVTDAHDLEPQPIFPSDRRLDVVLGLIKRLPLQDSPAWLAIKAIADAREEFPDDFSSRISVGIRRTK